MAHISRATGRYYLDNERGDVMNWLKKLFGGTGSKIPNRERGSHHDPGYGEVVDLRSEEGKAFERGAQSPLNKDDEAAARQLVALVSEAQEYKGSQNQEIREAKYEQLKEIGRQLYANGGHQRMLKVGNRVKALDSLAGSYVESYWNGIGEWQG